MKLQKKTLYCKQEIANRNSFPEQTEAFVFNDTIDIAKENEGIFDSSKTLTFVDSFDRDRAFEFKEGHICVIGADSHFITDFTDRIEKHLVKTGKIVRVLDIRSFFKLKTNDSLDINCIYIVTSALNQKSISLFEQVAGSLETTIVFRCYSVKQLGRFEHQHLTEQEMEEDLLVEKLLKQCGSNLEVRKNFIQSLSCGEFVIMTADGEWIRKLKRWN